MTSGHSTPFIVLTRGRTGSTVICDTLNQIAGVACLQEMFADPALLGVADEELFPHGRELLTIDAINEISSAHNSPWQIGEHYKMFWQVFKSCAQEPSLANYFYYLATSDGNPFVGERTIAAAAGCKVLSNHLGLSWEEVDDQLGTLAAIGCRVVLLMRRNIAREALSTVIAAKTQVFNQKMGTEQKPIPAFHVDTELVKQRMGNVYHDNQKLRELLEKHRFVSTEVFYEDFVADKYAFTKSIVEFLDTGVAQSDLDFLREHRDTYVKVTPDDLSQMIVNFDEIAALLEDDAK